MPTQNTHIIQSIMDDPLFKPWVMTEFNMHNSYWEQWKDNHPDNIAELNMAIHMLGLIMNSTQAENEVMWQKIENHIVQNKKVRILNIRWLLMASAVAACFLILWSGPQWFLAEKKIQSQSLVLTHELPDGSLVILNKDSELTYDSKEFTEKRVLDLAGEAYFEVKRGSTFEVKTTHGMVKVLGTSFNVFSRKDRFEVACMTGSVGVTPEATQSEQVLKPGDKIWAPDNKTYIVGSASAEPLWTSGSFYYDNDDLTFVLEELARQYQLELVLRTSVSGRKYSGFFTASDLQQALQSVCWPMHLHCEVIQSKLIISEK